MAPPSVVAVLESNVQASNVLSSSSVDVIAMAPPNCAWLPLNFVPWTCSAAGAEIDNAPPPAEAVFPMNDISSLNMILDNAEA